MRGEELTVSENRAPPGTALVVANDTSDNRTRVLIYRYGLGDGSRFNEWRTTVVVAAGAYLIRNRYGANYFLGNLAKYHVIGLFPDARGYGDDGISSGREP